MIIRWPQHIRQRCQSGENGEPCGEGPCWFCGGGLFACATCGGLEGGVPTHCPGERMSVQIQDAVYAGRLNYIFPHGWVTPADRQFKKNF